MSFDFWPISLFKNNSTEPKSESQNLSKKIDISWFQSIFYRIMMILIAFIFAQICHSFFLTFLLGDGQKCEASSVIDNASWNLTIFNIIRWVAGSMGQTTHRPSIWCSKYYFFSWFLAEFFAKIVSIYFLHFL